MNCHDNKNNEHKSHSHLKHMLHMVICCGIPILLIVALPFLKLNTSINTVILRIAPFICPIMMIFMIPMMFKGMKGEDSHKKQLDDGAQMTNKKY